MGIETKQEVLIWAVHNGLVDEVAVDEDTEVVPEGE